MNCPRCGATNRDGVRFCRSCGKPIAGPSSNPAAPAGAAAVPYALPNTPTAGTGQPQASGLICPDCQQSNRLGAKHCRSCGMALDSTRVCPHCRSRNRIYARRCQQCGQPLLSNAPPRRGTGTLSPTTLVKDRYQIVHKIAQGGMGAVYLARDTRLSDQYLGREKLVALKEMSQSAFTADQLPEAIRMFESEAKMLAHLDHPNLPTVTDFFEYLANRYLVMDYIKGETLEALVKKNSAPLRLPDVLKWANQLFGVFEFLHNQNPPIIYRDFKPSNVMLEESTGLLKLIDFGIARFLRKRTSKNLSPNNLSIDDAGVGTPGYAAPEQWKKGELLHPQSDVYSLGVVLHQLLTNYDPTAIPFSLPPIRQLNARVPVPLADAIAKAYAPALADRYATMRDFEQAFQQAWLQSFGGWNVPANAGS